VTVKSPAKSNQLDFHEHSRDFKADDFAIAVPPQTLRVKTTRHHRKTMRMLRVAFRNQPRDASPGVAGLWVVLSDLNLSVYTSRPIIFVLLSTSQNSYIAA
jgi:hypothetical protein